LLNRAAPCCKILFHFFLSQASVDNRLIPEGGREGGGDGEGEGEEEREEEESSQRR